MGNVCDPDDDNDTICDPAASDPSCSGADNCPYKANPDQVDTDSDSIGDLCDNCPFNVNILQEDTDGDMMGDACDDRPYVFNPLPMADGHYYSFDFESCQGMWCMSCQSDIGSGLTQEIKVIRFNYDWVCARGRSEAYGIMEFDIGSIDGLLRGHTEAVLALTVKDVGVDFSGCLYFHSIRDDNENGVLEEGDSFIDSGGYVGTICKDFEPGNTINIDVTSVVEHDLFDPDQTGFSGFVIYKDWSSPSFPGEWDDIIEFYDHTDPVNGPRLTVSPAESDSDDIPDAEDNCDSVNNPDQQDSYPPQGNGIGDACDCQSDFSCDRDVDGSDATTFKLYFGRNLLYYPCDQINPCNGDFSCDGDVDGSDAAFFKQDFGRSQFSNPCPKCESGVAWCTY